MLNDNGNVKRWEDIKVEFHLRNTLYCLKNVNALPKTWKDMILKDKRNARNLVLFDHHIVRKFQICSLNKLPSKEVKSYIIVDANTVKPTTQDYFKNLFKSSEFNWKKIYFLIRITTLDTKAGMFQYEVLHNILYANKMLVIFGKVISPISSSCKLHKGTIKHLFDDCLIVKRIWNQLKFIPSINLNFSTSTPQSDISGFWN